MTSSISEPVMQNSDPAQWREHRYGLTRERWDCLRGKAVWITGAGTGYGRCLAVALASAGARVFLTGRRKEKLQQSLQEMETLGVDSENCRLVEADLTEPDEIAQACEKIEGGCESLYGLINNAALPTEPGVLRPLQEGTLEYWEKLIRTNVTAPWLAARTIFPHMMRGSAARILFITSEAGWAFTPGFGPYNLSKTALNNLCGSLAQECAASFPDSDIQINALDPGEAKTEMNQNSNASPYSIVSMSLLLLSHPPGGPNGRFFHRDGRHLGFAYAEPYGRSLSAERPLVHR